jgi:transmembrane protein EpsG
MQQVFNYPSDLEWSDNTLFLYIGIVIFSSFFAFLSQRYYRVLFKSEDEIVTASSVHQPFLFVSFFILWFFSVFRNVGADFEAYEIEFLNSLSIEHIRSTTIEPGYILFNALIRLLTSNFLIFIIIITTLTLGLIYKTLLYFSEQLDLGMAVLIYSSLFYFQSYNLIRIYFASAILFYAFRYLVEKKYVKYLMILVLTTSIHTSAILMFIPFLIILYMQKNKYLIIVTLFAFISSFYAFGNVLATINFFERYQTYLQGFTNPRIGLGLLSVHIPVLILVHLSKRWIKDEYLMNLLFIYTYSGFTIALLGYSIPMIGRMSAYFLYQFVLLIPLVNRQLKFKSVKTVVFKTMVYGYLSYRLFLYFYEYLYLDKIMPYKTIFGWII